MCCWQVAEGGAAAPKGAWTNVRIGEHDHIAITEDSEWQRALMRELCAFVCDSEMERNRMDGCEEEDEEVAGRSRDIEAQSVYCA